MIKTLAQNRSGDGNHAYDIGLDESGDFAFSSGLSAYADIIADKVRTLEGEMQLDVENELAVDFTPYSLKTGNVFHKAFALNAIMISTPADCLTYCINSRFLLKRSS